MKTKHIIIGHYADLQADVKEGFGYEIQKAIFDTTVKAFKDAQVNIVVLAGDIFDKQEPTDSNRKLIYNHIVDILKLENVEEFVIFLGNHDYIKEEKNKDVYVGSNPIDTLVDFIEKVEPNLSRKLTYLKKQDIYNSKYDNNINWLSYSLEDGKSNGDNFHKKYNRENLPKDKLNLTVHHDILREYIDKSKLPIPKSTYNKLISINTPNSFYSEIVFGGDIHENIELYNVDESIMYSYPGNIFERNYGEGSYVTIRNKVTFKPSQQKVVNIHDITYDTFSGKITEKTLNKIPLTSYVKFLTIDLNTVKIFEGFNEKLINFLNEFNYPLDTLFIRFKMSNTYLHYEVGLRKLMDQLTELKKININVEFVYDKVITKSNDSEVINRMKLDMLKKDFNEGKFTETEFVALKSAIIDKLDLVSIANETGVDLALLENPDIQKHLVSIKPIVEVLSSENINENLDNVLLSLEQLKSLFKSQLTEIKPEIEKSLGNVELANAVTNEISSLFDSEIEFLMNTKPSFNIEPIFTENDSFMQLGYNKIYLNNPGRTRITGTNGVGKTTLYNMQRWVVKGVLFNTLKANQSVKNTLMVFNDEAPEIDNLFVKHQTLINGTKVDITRRASRKWKQGTTLGDKQDIDWKKYISSASHEVEVIVYKEGAEPQKFIGDKAQGLLDNWYGDIIDTVMIINQYRILEMLNKSGAELSSLILDYLADYLKNLENNLPKIKDKYNTKTPAFTLATLQEDLNKIKLKSTEIQNSSETLVNDINLFKFNIDENNKKTNKLNEDLTNLGNVPEKIISKNNKLSEIESKIETNNIQIQEFVVKEIPIFNKVMPILDEEKITNLNTEIGKKKENKEKLNDWVENLFKNYLNIYTERIKEFEPVVTELNDNYQKRFDEISNSINESLNNYTTEKNQLINDINTYRRNLTDELNVVITENKTLFNEFNNKAQQSLNERTKIEKNLEDNICSECKRPLSDLGEDHLIEVNKNIEKLNKEWADHKESETKHGSIWSAVNRILTTLESIPNDIKIINNHNLKDFVNVEVLGEEVSNRVNLSINKFETEMSTIAEKLTKLSNDSYVDDVTKQLLGQIGKPDINLTDKRINELQTLKINLQLNVNRLTKIKQNREICLNHRLKNEPFVSEYNEINDESLTEKLDILFTNVLKKTEVTEVNASIQKFIDVIDKTDAEVKQLNDEIQQVNNTFNSEVNQYNIDFNQHNKDVENINNHNKNISEYQTVKIQLETELNLINEELIKLNADKPKYDEMSLEYNRLVSETNKINLDLQQLQKDYQILENDKKSLEEQTETIKQKEQEYLEYRKNKEIYKIYELMIKKHFKSAVFAYYREFLNSTLNLLLEDLSFKLYWHEDGELYYREVKNGKIVNRPVILVSGMQTLFLGLSLLFTISLLNNQSNVSVLFIDEISGVLNSGKDLNDKKDIVNYQDQLLLLLNKFNNKNIFIIDHVIKNLFETCTYEVVATKEGSKYILID